MDALASMLCFLVASNALLVKFSLMKSLDRTRISLLRRCALIALPIALFAILWVVHWFYDPRIWTLERQARQYAGWAGFGAVNCGYVYSDTRDEENDGDYMGAIRKVVSANKQGKPFVVLNLCDVTDGQDAYVLIGTRTGRMFEFMQQTRDLGRGNVSLPASMLDISYLHDGDFEANLKRYFRIAD